MQGHHVAGIQQECTLVSTMQQMAKLQKEWDEHLRHGQELQQRQARLNADFGLDLVGLNAVFSHMNGASSN